ncbi:ATP-dependent protease La [Verruconis gallopava]|uniref:Lon protease homolog, mitochondrial n=1 Tax=Verruconis gallopava TaxID=253628 RepID=A0A0D1XST7_9PEZI|nr:ATP-dependent protease La [Verruconis gallopava]KIW05796.1 ATP-dependent protease La [Verruconis gallopava]
MLYGQNLPWRATARRSSQCLRIYSSRLPYTASHRAYRGLQSLISSNTQPIAVSPLASLLPSVRNFSTVSRRWKDKPPHGPKDEPELATGEKSEDKAAEKSEGKVAEKSQESEVKAKTHSTSSSNAPDGKGSAGGTGGSNSGIGDGSSGGAPGRRRKGEAQSQRALTKPMVPDVYPQVMAIPIAKRPLFPHFYKTISIRNPQVIAALAEAYRRGQPYVGVFLLKDDNADKDVIESMDEVYDVGTFCQVTSFFPHQGGEDGTTAVLYPHRRIKMSELYPPESKDKATQTIVEELIGDKKDGSSQESEKKTEDKRGDVVPSFEEEAVEVKDDRVQKRTQQQDPTSFLQRYGVSMVKVENVLEEEYDASDSNIKALTNEIVSTFRDIATKSPMFKDQVSTFTMSQNGNVAENPFKLADLAAVVTAGEPAEMQAALEATNAQDRLYKSLTMLKKEAINAELQFKIQKDVEDKIKNRQREYWLMEQMKGIKRELGMESDGKDKLIEGFKEKAAKLAMPEPVRKVFDEEVSKLSHLEPAASEFNVTRNYLDWLTVIPWGQRSAENFGIRHAMEVLDEDHHGLKDVKDRILEFIAVGKLRGTVEGKILCMVGPPGVGKTSIGKSIARALNRQYYRFSVGGLTDVAEIKGHRRTYVGALPGRIIQALKKCQTENPLILIDEVDKIGRGVHGDPSSALLELLDPEQNSSFLDHYMDVPVDLSKVLFVCTANMTDTIPRPLLDRMEMIELSGYVADEKMAIAERYLAPAAKELSGLKDADVLLEKDAITELINKYCRESGVRNLKKQIEKVYRKAALKIIQDIGETDPAISEDQALTPEGKAAQAEAEKDSTEAKSSSEISEKETTEKPRIALEVPKHVHVRINKDNLKDYVGPPIFTSDRLYETTPPGVAMGLAWTSMGGAALYVESILQSSLAASGTPGLERTGNLKPVMKESTQIAYSFAKGFLAQRFPENKFFDHAKVHLHCPEGAVQKDGPSAGITMASSLLSLALDEKLSAEIAMTGELTVTGKVLRIGGLREKTVAARRAGAKTIIFPRDNWSDWLELPENIKEDIEGKPVDWYADVFEILFPNVDTQRANTLWKDVLNKSKKQRKHEPKSEEDEQENSDD